MSTRLRQFLYISHPTASITDADCADIVASARRNNARVGLTGMLLYVPSRAFVQVLEGEPSTITDTLSVMLRDVRHAWPTVLLDHRVDRRAFAGWPMGYRRMTLAELATADGYAGYSVDSLRDDDRSEEGRIALRMMLRLYESGNPGMIAGAA
jgi:hypothetical protein